MTWKHSLRGISGLGIASVAVLSLLLFAGEARPDQTQDRQGGRQDARPEHSWSKALENRTDRGKLSDQSLDVRGDSGKWSEVPRLQHAPPLQRKPARVALDDWSDQLRGRKFQPTKDDDNWLLFRTGQLDDNDRVWVERVERRGNGFTVIAHQAVWQGRYQKNFTWHKVLGVNLGKLEPGSYEAKWIVQPLVFRTFEDPKSPGTSWPKDERPAGGKPVELRVEFTVAAEGL